MALRSLAVHDALLKYVTSRATSYCSMVLSSSVSSFMHFSSAQGAPDVAPAASSSAPTEQHQEQQPIASLLPQPAQPKDTPVGKPDLFRHKLQQKAESQLLSMMQQRQSLSEPPAGSDQSHSQPEADSASDEDTGEFVNKATGEVGGPKGKEPTRYGDWAFKGRCTDF